MASHRQLLLDAKEQQRERLQEAGAAADQLAAAVSALIKANSLTSAQNTSSVIEKISTIHELDKEIDRQLNDDIAPNYVRAVNEKERLGAYIKKSRRSLAVDTESQSSYVDVLQRRLELADQEIRVLENTLSLVDAKKR